MTHLFITDSDFSCTNKIFLYLLGFQPSLGAMILSESKLKILLDGRYIEKTKDIDTRGICEKIGNKKLEVAYICIQEFTPAIITELQEVENLCMEENIAIKYREDIQEAYPSINLKTGNHKFNKNREIKTQSEQVYIKHAITIIDTVFLYIQELARAGELFGKTELEVRGMIIYQIFKNGGEGESFSTIVAFGKNSAVPHHTPGQTVIKNGPLLIDMGALYEGYCSDFTRTIWVGEKTEVYPKFIEISEIVAKAHEASIIGYNSGMTGKGLYNISRKVIHDAGYGPNYTHGLGHGVGLDIHEAPKISKTGDSILKEGMVFTIEPGIYLPGEFGVRLEDIVFHEGKVLKKYSHIPLLEKY